MFLLERSMPSLLEMGNLVLQMSMKHDEVFTVWSQYFTAFFRSRSFSTHSASGLGLGFWFSGGGLVGKITPDERNWLPRPSCLNVTIKS
jgi:hypothetical protein